MKKRILLIHPEGNINNNPNLHGIVELLAANGYYIDIFSKHFPNINQNVTINNTRIFLEKEELTNKTTSNLLHKLYTTYVCVIGIDLGIVEAAKIAKFKKIHVGYISYEIFFEAETSKDEKKIEQEACKNINFAIVQDKIRAKHLSEQNEIPMDKMIYIPVAGYKSFKRKPNKYLHKRLGIPEDKRIAILTGSVNSWSIPIAVLENVRKWNSDWVLVLHNRYGMIGFEKEHLKISKKNKQIFISYEQTNTVNELSIILNSADVGLAFYDPDYLGKYTGKNIEDIGLSSGKISTYLANGLPIISNKKEPLNTLNKKYKFGLFVNNYNEVADALDSINCQTYDCELFFNEELNLKTKIKPLLKLIDSFENNKKVCKAQKKIITEIFDNSINKYIENILNEKQQIKNSKTFKIGAMIVKPYQIIVNFIKKNK